MTTTALIGQRARGEAPGARASGPHVPDSSDLPPLLSVVPQAGPAVFAYVAFGVVLLLLLVPPLTLLATLVGVALIVAAALVVLAMLAGAVLAAPILLVRRLREHPLGHLSLQVPHVRRLKVRRV
jgi:hypothetical protein